MGINLLSWREDQYWKHAKYFLYLLTCILLLLSMIILSYYWHLYELNNIKKTQYQYWQKLTSSTPFVDYAKRKQRYLQHLVLTKFLENMRNKQVTMFYIWQALDEALPKNVHLTYLQLEHSQLLLQGEAHNSQSITNMLNSLQENSLFHNIVLQNLHSANKTEDKFSSLATSLNNTEKHITFELVGDITFDKR